MSDDSPEDGASNSWQASLARQVTPLVSFLYGPERSLKMGLAGIKARRAAALELAQTARDVALIESGEKSLSDFSLELPFKSNEPAHPERLERIEPKLTVRSVALAAGIALTAERLREDINVAQAVLIADEELESAGSGGPEKDIDDDWLRAWRRGAGSVSQEQMQRLWGSLLAKELQDPGKYSLRTMHFLQTLSTKEAQEVSSLLRFTISSNFILASDLLEKHGWPFGKLLQMQSLGVISGVEGEGVQILLNKMLERNKTEILYGGKVFKISKAAELAPDAGFEIYPLTSIGIEVASLGVFEPVEAYEQEIIESLKKHGFECTVEAE